MKINNTIGKDIFDWVINIKGYASEQKIESITGKKYIDCSLSYGNIYFRGTEDDKNDFCSECYKDESEFKIIGITKQS
jgi:hypothetical protein